MFGKIVILSALVAVSLAELPVSGPYAPSGWRPQGRRFVLPNQYTAPQRQQGNGVELEITKERVDFAGQFTGTRSGQTAPNTAYLPPTSDEVDEPLGVDIIRIQSLPSGPINKFKVFRTSQLNTREYFPQRQFAPIRSQQKFANNYRQQEQQQQFKRQKLQPFKILSAQYGAPAAEPATQYGAPVVQPAAQYGAPSVQPVAFPDPRIVVTSDTNFSSAENEEIAEDTITKGEYFVLTPEKTLQKVSYKTSQSDEEARNNGFTAQLKYEPVEKVNGPLYKYNEQGQLVRIYKK